MPITVTPIDANHCPESAMFLFEVYTLVQPCILVSLGDYTCVRVCLYVCMCVCVCISMCMYACVCACVHTQEITIKALGLL